MRSSSPTPSRGGCFRPSRRSAPNRTPIPGSRQKSNSSNRKTIAVLPNLKSRPNPNFINHAPYFQQLTVPTQFSPLIISNRESLRLEMPLTPTKQKPDPISNRELERVFTPASSPPTPQPTNPSFCARIHPRPQGGPDGSSLPLPQ